MLRRSLCTMRRYRWSMNYFCCVTNVSRGDDSFRNDIIFDRSSQVLRYWQQVVLQEVNFYVQRKKECNNGYTNHTGYSHCGMD